MIKKIKTELKSATYTFLATFLLVIITSFINSTSINWDDAAVVGALLAALRAGLKAFIPLLTSLINVKKI